MAVLYWIQNNKPWKQYVGHRVKEIRQLTDKNQWFHCPGMLNPANLPSRGTTGQELVQSMMWWNGPAFLQLSWDKWPLTETSQHMDEVIQSELVKNVPVISYAFSATSVDIFSSLNQVIDCTRFSNITRLLRVTAFVLRFISKSRTSRSTSNKQYSSRWTCQFIWVLMK